MGRSERFVCRCGSGYSQIRPSMASLSVLSVSEANIQQYAQGNFVDVSSDIRRYIHPADVAEGVISILCEEYSIDSAFNLRRELIALKKVLLRLSEKSARQTHTLTRLTTWLYTDIEISSADPARDDCSWITSENYKISSDALHVSKGTAAALIEARGTMKSLCCIPRFPQPGPISAFGGVSGRKLASTPHGTIWWKILNEANDFLESIGEEGVLEWAEQLQHQCGDDTSLCYSGSHILELVRGRVTAMTGSPEWTNNVVNILIARGVWKACEMRFQAVLLSRKLAALSAGLQHALSQLQRLLQSQTLHMPAPCSDSDKDKRWMLVTHGKKHICLLETALEVVSELHVWLCTLLRYTHHATSTASHVADYVRGYCTLHSSTTTNTVGEDNDVDWNDRDCYRPLFLAGDPVLAMGGSRTDMQAMYFPTSFVKLPALVDKSSANIEKLFPIFVSSVEANPWPPPVSTDTINSGVLGKCICLCCKGQFSKIWIEVRLNLPAATPAFDKLGGDDDPVGGVCCECVRRYKAKTGRCSQLIAQEIIAEAAALSGKGKKAMRSVLATSAPLPCVSMFCPHKLHCVLHDGAGRGAFSCFLCGIHKGDGGDVLQLCSALACSQGETTPQTPLVMLFLDFDRTLCSTKSGSDPDPPAVSGSVTRMKHRTVHSIDDELREAARDCGVYKTFVVTRNSHGSSICRFLVKNDCPVIGVHIVSKKSGKLRVIPADTHCNDTGRNTENDHDNRVHFEQSRSKSKVILRLIQQARAMDDSGRGVVGVFVDDDIVELREGGDDLAAANVHRFLFCRGAL